MRRATLLVAACVLAACSHGGKPKTDPEPQTETVLHVENQNYLDMTVYVTRSSQRIRLGIVPGFSSRNFFLPPYVVGPGVDLFLVADPIGSTRTAVSQSIFVTPGDVVQFIIPSRIP